MRKPILGEKLWLVKFDQYRMSKDKESGQKCIVTKECIVTKVGRKYFEADGIRFLIENWREVTEYTPTYTLYESKQIWLDKQEKDKYLDNFRKVFFYYSKEKEFTLDQLRGVAKILEIKIDER